MTVLKLWGHIQIAVDAPDSIDRMPSIKNIDGNSSPERGMESPPADRTIGECSTPERGMEESVSPTWITTELPNVPESHLTPYSPRSPKGSPRSPRNNPRNNSTLFFGESTRDIILAKTSWAAGVLCDLLPVDRLWTLMTLEFNAEGSSRRKVLHSSSQRTEQSLLRRSNDSPKSSRTSKKSLNSPDWVKGSKDSSDRFDSPQKDVLRGCLKKSDILRNDSDCSTSNDSESECIILNTYKNRRYLKAYDNSENPMVNFQNDFSTDINMIINEKYKNKHENECDLLWRHTMSLRNNKENEKNRRVRFNLPNSNCGKNQEEEDSTTPNSDDSDDNETHPDRPRRKSNTFMRRNFTRFTPQNTKIDECEELGLIDSRVTRKNKRSSWKFMNFKVDNESKVYDERNL